jgi:ribA/ribD-fused uncharacterized protein
MGVPGIDYEVCAMEFEDDHTARRTRRRSVKSKEDLLDALSHGEKFEYLFFWGHQPSADGSITKSCFSQWFEAPFEKDGRSYPTAEHFMMAGKAELFGDSVMRDAILAADSPGKAKALGRKVQGFDEAKWLERRWDIVVEANMLKFGQNQDLREFLLATNDKVLVEASPFDKIWGIGMAVSHADALDPSKWKGLNLLGFALMEVRRNSRRQS